MTEKFENIDLLIQKIKTDKNTENVTEKRFPVRYIFLSNFETLKEFITETEKIGINRFELSELLTKNDGWITKQELISKIKNLDNNKDYLIIPFSEIARFYDKNDFSNLFNQLNELENIGNTNQRIYLPLMGIKVRFEEDFLKNFNRKIEYSFVWVIDEEIKPLTVFLYNNDLSLNINNIKKIKGTKEWLNLWKIDLSSPALVLSKTLLYLSDNAKPDELFDLKKINNIKELINNIFNIDIPIDFKDSEIKYWVKIIDYLNEKTFNSFYALAKKIVNANEINTNNAIELWIAPNRNDFEKWIIKSYLLSHECIENSYLCQVLFSLNSLDNTDLLMGLWNTIFSITNPSDKVLNERTDLLNQAYCINKLELPSNFVNDYKQQLEKIDKKNKLRLISGHLEVEKELIIKIFSEDQDEEILAKFPCLQKYLEEVEFDNLKEEQQWIYSYFNEYKNSKLKNVYSNGISSLINEINSNEEAFYKWYYSFEDVSALLNNKNIDYIFWVDALGIEWVSLVEHLLKNKKYNIENKYIAKVNLPSTTEANRYNGNNIKYFQDFDKFIHDKTYQYPKTIIEEFKKLKEIIEKLVIYKNKRAMVISDHGLSALVRLNDSSKNFTQANHEGRYIKSENTSYFQKDVNYIIKDIY